MATLSWEANPNGKANHGSLFVINEQGKKIEMAGIHPSNPQDPSKGMTLIKRDMNYGGERFIAQGDQHKEWNLTLEGAKDRGSFFATQQMSHARALVGAREPSREMAQVGPEHTHDRGGHDR